ncbi:hypothetical protein [Thermocrinis sp.]
MENYRGRYTSTQHKVKGVALISVLVTGILVAVAIAGLYYILLRTFGTSERVRVYTSTKEAAVGGVNYVVSQIKSGVFDTMIDGNCPSGGQTDANNCCEITTRYRLSGDSEYTNKIRVCLSGYSPPPGEQISGVAYSRFSATGGGYIYSIVSEAEGPRGSMARIEAVYMR